jgi:iron(III) transport system ATP-binding protein
MTSAIPVQIRIDHVSRRFDQTVALDDVDLTIAAGELFFLLGPSGCGKSTLLRIIAGLLEPSAGRIFFNDRDVTPLGTDRRNAVMVFQSYALWPHMTVRENVRFGLAVRHVPRDEQERRIDEVLRLVQMQDLSARKPNELSGGQQQRVALGRALAVQPACLLLDEPLSNLDAKLRQEMRSEIRRICKTAGFTTIYVTHDQKEALSVADRIAVLRAGRLAQVGTPAELYHRPNSGFVAEFIGQTNLLDGRIVGRDPADRTVRVQTAAGTLLAASDGSPTLADGAAVRLSIRPEQIRIARNGTAGSASANRLSGRAVETSFLGETSEHVVLVGDRQRLKVISAPPLLDPPSQPTLEFDARDVVVLPAAD